MFRPVEVLRLVEVDVVYVHLNREPKPRMFEVWFRTEDNGEAYYHYYAKDELHAYQRGLECIAEYKKINQAQTAHHKDFTQTITLIQNLINPNQTKT